jgi:hypothetical protein
LGDLSNGSTQNSAIRLDDFFYVSHFCASFWPGGNPGEAQIRARARRMLPTSTKAISLSEKRC